MAGKTLIIGAGYAGLPLALELKARGREVVPWVHSEESAARVGAAGFSLVLAGSVGHAACWRHVPGDFELAIHCASSSRGGESAYEEVFVQGAKRLGGHLPRARTIFVSSTSVYGQNGGEIVTEESPAEPSTATGKILREAEAIALENGATVVRSSGIYGPGRAVLWEKFQRGEAVIEGDGSRWINQIHRRDLVAALIRLIDHGRPGQIYNATDDTPVTQRDYYAWCAQTLQRPLPPSGPVNPNRKRGLTSKRVSNARLHAAGWAPIYPSFREGICSGDR